MKKHVWFLVLLAAMAVLLVSCSPEAGMQKLDESDITDSWVNGYWSGTITVQINDNEPTETTVNHQYYTASAVKAMCNKKGSVSVGSTGADFSCDVYSNLARNKINLVQKSSVSVLGTTSTSITRWQFTKDKNQSE